MTNKKIFITLAMTLMPMLGMANDGVKLNVLGNSHSLVRVDDQKRYVLLPVEDAAAESHIRVTVAGQLVQTINVRLAQNHIDYYVPLDLAAYDNKEVVLDVRSDAGRDGRRSVTEATWSKHLKMSDTFDKTNTETKWRPAYHHTPEYAWMNDPNGMFYKDGLWHLCYQYGPYGSTWNNMTWGHSISKDLMHWQQVDDAIKPDALGTIFSGSAVVDSLGSAGYGKDAIIAMYTQADRSQFQSMAYSTDGGKTFTPYKMNPVLTQDYEFRDPHMFRHDATGKWIVMLANALGHEMDIYSSTDLKQWSKESSFGKGYGSQAGVWECPDLLELPIRGEKGKKWVLICNINPGGPFGGSATQYFTGDFDGHKFTCDTRPEVEKWMDWGKDHYASVSWNSAPNGRTTMIAWMSNWQYANSVPTKQFRSANTLPREVELYRGDDGELYLASTPSPEVDAARDKVQSLGNLSAGATKAIPANAQGACELDVNINAGKARKVTLTLANKRGEEVVMTLDMKARKLVFNRAKSGEVAFSDDFRTTCEAPLPKGSQHNLRIFIDKSSIEIFEADGRWTMTNIVFPNEPYSQVRLASDGGKAKASVKVYPIR